MASTRTIKVDYLARVEGEGALYVKVEGDRVADVKLNIFEPPRFFEAFLQGRGFQEVPDITARICGICPVAYQMSAVHALENALGITVSPEVRALRRLMYCAEWIESHALHIYLLHAPDFLGYESSITLAADHPVEVKRGLRLKKIGNELLALLGGRSVHPVSACVGGFYRAPRRRDLLALRDDLAWALEAAHATVHWVSGFDFPDFTTDCEFVALRHPGEYPLNEGRVVSSKGLDIAIEEYDQYFIEEHVAHSNALQSHRIGGGSFFVGPLARVNLNFGRLSLQAQAAARASGIAFPNSNAFTAIVARAIELVHVCEEALQLLDKYVEPSPSRVEVVPRAGTGCAATEAPRGLLYHRYEVDQQGLIRTARIVPPTSQNLRRIEDDLRAFVPTVLDLPEEDATWRCEQLVRNYDPCISCATHFLKLRIERD
ncbi:MAG: dehydrogenase [Chloroflexi bacterium RBG_16_57_9]|nr:MAG: dehydrogenase [Chloroflexi bacterium RBG_16_57_9]